MGISVTMPEIYKETTPLEVKNKNIYDKPGIYVFYNLHNVPLYVGKTVSFKRRFMTHFRTSEFFSESSKVVLYYTDDPYERDVYETYLIKELMPSYNKAKTYYTRLEYEDALHETNERIEEIKDKIVELEYEECSEHDVDWYDDSFELGNDLYTFREIEKLEEELHSLYANKARIASLLNC